MAARILIVEDNEMSFVLADYLLRQAGYGTQRALDGATAVRMAVENPSDLILCDLDLPVMDGYQVATTLRATQAWREVPLIAFTADSTGSSQEKLLAAGFTGYIQKPPDPSTFRASVAHYLPAHLRAS
jgi:CheY-like chemotaxis protein